MLDTPDDHGWLGQNLYKCFTAEKKGIANKNGGAANELEEA